MHFRYFFSLSHFYSDWFSQPQIIVAKSQCTLKSVDEQRKETHQRTAKENSKKEKNQNKEIDESTS